MPSANIPENGQNNLSPSNNPAAQSVGPFCQLAQGISAPISELIQSTYGALNSLQGAVNSLIYAPARGLTILQNRILSGEIVNSKTLNTVFSIVNAIKNAGVALATAVISNTLSRLADKAKSLFSNVVKGVSSALSPALQKVGNAFNGLNKLFTNADAAINRATSQLASIPGPQFTSAALQNLSPLQQIGQGVVGIGQAALSDFKTITGGILRPVTSLIGTIAAPFQVPKAIPVEFDPFTRSYIPVNPLLPGPIVVKPPSVTTYGVAVPVQ